MGLAASQCRLLFLTSRQNDLSAKMQRISMEKMRLASDEDDAYAEYQRLYNKKVYQNEDGTDLSYDSIMGATAAQSGVQNYITDAAGRLVLNQKYFNALGIDSNKKEGDGSDITVDKNEFIAAVSGLTPEQINSIQNLDIKTKEEWLADDLGKNYMTSAGLSASRPTLGATESVTFESGEDLIKKLSEGENGLKLSDLTGQSGGCYGGKDGGYVESNKSLEDLYNIGASFTDQVDGQALYLGDNWNLASSRVEDIVDRLVDKSIQILGIQDSDALKLRQNKGNLAGPYKNWSRLSDTGWGYDSSMEKAAASAINNGAKCGYTFKKGHESDGYRCFAINIKLLLRDFASYMRSNLKTTNNANIIYSQFTGATQAEIDAWDAKAKEGYDAYVAGLNPGGITDSQMQLVNFYGNIYDKASQGWIAPDADTIQKNLNQGLYYINNEKISNSDNYNEVSDKEAQEEAKTWYDNELRRIKRKEDQWDTQLNRTQTEYTAITNDYNSVKSIIDANIQKSFTYCSNG